MAQLKKVNINKCINRDIHGEDAVSPALGAMILVVVMLTITGAVISWGLPIIQKMEADSRYKNTLGYFHAINDNIEDLVIDRVGAMRATRVSLGTGHIFIEEEYEKWVVTYNVVNDYDILFSNFEDRSFLVVSNPSTDMNVYLYWPEGDELGTPVEPAQGNPIASGEIVLVPQEYTLTGTVFIEVEEYPSNILLAEAWLMGIDTITFKMSSAAGHFCIREENGGLTSDYPDTKHVVDAPMFLENKAANAVTLYMIKLTSTRGLTSATAGSYNINFHLIESYIETAWNVKNLRIHIHGAYNDTWYRDLTEEHRLYHEDPGAYTGFVMDYNNRCVKYQVPNPHNPELGDIVNVKLIRCTIDVCMEAA